MKKYSVFLDKGLVKAGANGELRKDPKAFRHINTAIMAVIEMAMTCAMPDISSLVVGGMENITLDPKEVYAQAGEVNRLTCHLSCGLYDHLSIKAEIVFHSHRRVLRIVAGADSDGIRFIRIDKS